MSTSKGKMLTIDCLPVDCLLLLLHFLSTPDLVNVLITCTKFYNLLVCARSVFRRLDFRCFDRRTIHIPCEGVWINIIHMKFLSLRFCVKIRNFQPLKEMSKLERLVLFCTNVSDEDLGEFITKGLSGINIGCCDRLTAPLLLKDFLIARPNLTMVGLAALDKAVNNEVRE